MSGSRILKVDAKGRVFLPKNVLETEDEERGVKEVITSFWLTPGLDGALWLLDAVEWRRMQRRLRTAEIGDARLRAVQRLFFENAERVKLDAQGRILIPEAHRAMAEITDQVVALGVARRIEIWSPAVFDAYKAAVASTWHKDLEAILSGEAGPM